MTTPGSGDTGPRALALLMVFAPLAVFLYRRTSAG